MGPRTVCTLFSSWAILDSYPLSSRGKESQEATLMSKQSIPYRRSKKTSLLSLPSTLPSVHQRARGTCTNSTRAGKSTRPLTSRHALSRDAATDTYLSRRSYCNGRPFKLHQAFLGGLLYHHQAMAYKRFCLILLPVKDNKSLRANDVASYRLTTG
jgi:hypothetical protein